MVRWYSPFVDAVRPAKRSAMSFAVGALATLGGTERAREMAERAMLLDPDLDAVRGDPRFKAMLETAEQRLAGAS